MRNLIYALLPESMTVVVVMSVGLALIIGLLSWRSAYSIIATLILSIVAAPFVESLMMALPWWMVAALILWFVLFAARKVLTLLLGETAGAHVVAVSVIGVVKLVARSVGWLVALPFRIIVAARSETRL